MPSRTSLASSVAKALNGVVSPHSNGAVARSSWESLFDGTDCKSADVVASSSFFKLTLRVQLGIGAAEASDEAIDAFVAAVGTVDGAIPMANVIDFLLATPLGVGSGDESKRVSCWCCNQPMSIYSFEAHLRSCVPRRAALYDEAGPTGRVPASLIPPMPQPPKVPLPTESSSAEEIEQYRLEAQAAYRRSLVLCKCGQRFSRDPFLQHMRTCKPIIAQLAWEQAQLKLDVEKSKLRVAPADPVLNEPKAVAGSTTKPSWLRCYVCGSKSFTSENYASHISDCLAARQRTLHDPLFTEWPELLPPTLSPPVSAVPPAGAAAEEFTRFNVASQRIFEAALPRCVACNSSFDNESFLLHARSCAVPFLKKVRRSTSAMTDGKAAASPAKEKTISEPVLLKCHMCGEYVPLRVMLKHRSACADQQQEDMSEYELAMGSVPLSSATADEIEAYNELSGRILEKRRPVCACGRRIPKELSEAHAHACEHRQKAARLEGERRALQRMVDAAAGGITPTERMLLCFLCGLRFGAAALRVHLPKCEQAHAAGVAKLAVPMRTSLRGLPKPSAVVPAADAPTESYAQYNREAAEILGRALDMCRCECGLRFAPSLLMEHMRTCVAASKHKPENGAMAAADLNVLRRKLPCFACSQSIPAAALPSHLSSCVARRAMLISEIRDHPAVLPPAPSTPIPAPDDAEEAWAAYTAEAIRAYQSSLLACGGCRRKLDPLVIARHVAGCAAYKARLKPRFRSLVDDDGNVLHPPVQSCIDQPQLSARDGGVKRMIVCRVCALRFRIDSFRAHETACFAKQKRVLDQLPPLWNTPATAGLRSKGIATSDRLLRSGSDTEAGTARRGSLGRAHETLKHAVRSVFGGDVGALALELDAADLRARASQPVAHTSPATPATANLEAQRAEGAAADGVRVDSGVGPATADGAAACALAGVEDAVPCVRRIWKAWRETLRIASDDLGDAPLAEVTDWLWPRWRSAAAKPTEHDGASLPHEAPRAVSLVRFIEADLQLSAPPAASATPPDGSALPVVALPLPTADDSDAAFEAFNVHQLDL